MYPFEKGRWHIPEGHALQTPYAHKHMDEFNIELQKQAWFLLILFVKHYNE